MRAIGRRGRKGWRAVLVGLTAAGLVGCAAGATPGAGSNAPGGPPSSSTGNTSGLATGGPIAAGGDFCALLGPGDFAAAGVSGAGTPTANTTGVEGTGAYCVYAGKSSATGGIEFDVFVTQPADTGDTYTLTTGEMSQPADVTADVGADQAALVTGGPGAPAVIAVRKGVLVFDVGTPSSQASKAQLVALAKLVIQRAANLIGPANPSSPSAAGTLRTGA
ncbi:MAG: acyl-CoA dehydrogenase [Chloroflexi bacterium]|nr:MAG: acyl-CoA dehydrogenase [Chloroflexota bacterium]